MSTKQYYKYPLYINQLKKIKVEKILVCLFSATFLANSQKRESNEEERRIIFINQTLKTIGQHFNSSS